MDRLAGALFLLVIAVAHVLAGLFVTRGTFFGVNCLEKAFK